jgi:hypothetical protein
VKRVSRKLEDALKRFETVKSSPRTRKAAKWTLLFIVLFTVVGFFVLPPIVKSVLLKKLSETLHRDVAIQKLTINPYMLSMKITGFEVKERDGTRPFVSFDELYLNAQLVSLVKKGIILKEIRLRKPYINIERSGEILYNFSDLVKGSASGAKADDRPLRFSLNNIQVMNGSVDFWDGPKKTKHTIRNMIVTIPFFSNLPYYTDSYVKPSFEANVNGHQVGFYGMTKPFKDSLETSVEVSVHDFDIPYYLAYVPVEMNFRVPSGRLDVETLVFYTQYKDKAPSLTLTGSVRFRDIRIVDKKENPLIQLPLLAISISSAELTSRKFLFSKVYLGSPEIHVVRDKTGRINLQALVTETEKGHDLKKEEASPVLAVDADEVSLTGGKISFSDSLQPEAFRTALENINVQIQHFSNARDRKSAVALSLETESKEGLKVAGEFTVVPLASEGTVELARIPLKKYSPYYRRKVLFDVLDGVLDLSTGYAFQQGEKEPDIRLAGLTANVTSLKLKKRDEKNEFLRIPEIAVRETATDLLKRELVIGEFSTGAGFIMVERSEDGKWNLQTLLPPAPTGEKGVPRGKHPDEKPWMVTANKISVQRYVVRGKDLVPSQPVSFTAEDIKFDGEALSTEKNRKGRVSFALRLNRKGSVSANGSLALNPISANVKLNCRNLDIVPFQAYLADRVKLLVGDGALSSAGSLSLAYSEEAGPRVTYKGELSLTNFLSVDAVNADDFLKWNSLHLGNLRAGYNPFYLNIDEIALTDFYSWFIINEDGTLNVQEVVTAEKGEEVTGAGATTPGETGVREQKGPGRTITIEKVTLQGGTLNFSDRHVKPNFSANLLEIGGRISGLSSEENKFADVDLKGKLGDYAPLEITGRINPLREDLYVELKADFKDIDLSPMSPYGGKYMGYTIQKGQLSLSMQYLIVKRKLDSQNNLFLDQFTLGDRVESPDATKLPVKLAIALLKNRKGEISLDLPVTGDLDDPKFSLGRIIIKILVNILVKAATSPFALLGAIFGGGEELSYIEFDYGSSTIGDQGIKKLDTLIKALYDRPGLKLDIEGRADPEKDKEGLRQYIFQKKVRAQKLKELAKKGSQAVTVDEITISSEEYPKYLKMAYKEEKFPKPRNIIGMAKDLPVPEMEKLMLTHIQVTEDDLRSLASQRALNVKNHILKSQKVEQERLFLVESKTLQAEKKEKVKDSRVDFKLK